MGIREDICEILACQAEIKKAIAGIDGASLQEICDKIDATDAAVAENLACLEELKAEILSECPLVLAEPLLQTVAVVKGDQVLAAPTATTLDVKTATKTVIGTAEVSTATYTAADDTTTLALVNNTVTAADLSTATTLTKQSV